MKIIKSYGDKASNFHDQEMSKVGSNYTCLTALFISKNNATYHVQVFLIECKYFQKERKVIRYITDDLEICPDHFWQKIGLELNITKISFL